MKKVIFIFLMGLLIVESRAQNNDRNIIWHEHLPWHHFIAVADAGGIIWAATPYALLYYQKSDHSTHKMTTIDGLSATGISTINFSKDYQTLVIAYTDANIDLLKNDSVYNIPGVFQATIPGNKIINHICFIGKYAYLSCGFGIVVIDLVQKSIQGYYYIGPGGNQINVMAMAKSDADTLFVATESGIYLARVNSSGLADFSACIKDIRIDPGLPYNTIANFSGEIVVNKKRATRSNLTGDTLFRYSGGHWTPWLPGDAGPIMKIQSANDYLCISLMYLVKIFGPVFSYIGPVWSYYVGEPYPLDAIPDEDQRVWIADEYLGLIASHDLNNAPFERIDPGGPLRMNAFSMTSSGNDVYVAPGGRDNSYVPFYLPGEVYHFDNPNWQNHSGSDLGNVHDVVNVAVNPSYTNAIFAGTWGNGLVEFHPGSSWIKYGESNSTLRHHSLSDTSDIRIGGTAFDQDANLFVVCSHTNYCLSRKSGNNWTGYYVPLTNERDLGQIVIDSSDQKWILMHSSVSDPNSILVFSDNGTPENPTDDQSKVLNNTPGNGNIPGICVFSIKNDRTGKIWIGTENGAAVFNSPEEVLTGQPVDCQWPVVPGEGFLLAGQTVTAIATDVFDRKWFGTDREGIYVFNSDGTQQQYHFTQENSPLFSNHISCIEITAGSSIFIGTDKGIISCSLPPPGGINSPEGSTGNIDATITPNPFYDRLSLDFSLETHSPVTITIDDVSGKKVFQKDFPGKKGKNKITIEPGIPATGFFLLNLRDDHRSCWKKIIKL